VRPLDALKEATTTVFLQARDESARVEAYQEVTRFMVPAVAGWRVDAIPSLGQSKIGGKPHLPASVAWPSDAAGRPRLAFLLQVNLAEVAAIEHENPLPRSGMLYLFAVCDKKSAQSYIMGPDNTAVVFVSEPHDLLAREYPESLPDKARIEETALQFGASVYLEELVEPGEDDEPNVFDDAGEPIGKRAYYRAKRFDHALEARFVAALEQCGSHYPELKLVKQPWLYQDEAQMQFNPNTQIELLSFAGETVSLQYRGCDFHLVIDKGSLAQGRLDEAFVIFESGT
jgi:Domain of unknown function (DUF1963)